MNNTSDSVTIREHGVVDPDELLERLTEAISLGAIVGFQDTLKVLVPAEIAQLLESIPPDQRNLVWDEIDDGTAGEVLSELHEGVRDRLIESMDKRRLINAVKSLDIDDIADIIPGLPEDVVAALMTRDRTARENLTAVLSYPEDTAGGLMNIDTLTVREGVPLAVVQRYLRLRGEMPEYTDKLFVVDRQNRLTGTLFVSSILTEDASQFVAEFVEREPITFQAHTPTDEVSHAFELYNLISAPVVDEDERLIGRITIDDVVDVIREEADHTLMAQAGLNEEEDLFAPVLATAGSRALWLGVNLITAILASWVIGQFEATIEQLVALAVLMPIVASMGGNAGTQTLTVIIRGLAQGTVTRANARRVFIKELLVGGLNGLLFAFAVMGVAVLWYGNPMLGLIVAVAMAINLVSSAMAGVCLPVLFEKLNIDPALASGVALTTITDVVGFSSVLGIAALVLV